MHKDVQARATTTGLMWFSYLGLLWFSIGALGAWVALLAFVLMIPLVTLSVFMWGIPGMEASQSKKEQTDSAEESEKRKRDRLDAVLRDLSEDDLLRLRQRLHSGDIDDGILYDRLVGDDGELVEVKRYVD